MPLRPAAVGTKDRHIMERFRYLTKELLTDLNDQAIMVRAENHLSRGTVKRLPDMNFPVVNHFLQADSSVRLEIGLSFEGRTGFVDVSVAEFVKLPEVQYDIPPEALEELSSFLASEECTFH
jgi:hypothetical protein